MSNVRRIYVEKRPAYAVRAKELTEELREYLNLSGLSGVRVLTRYDVEHVTDETYEKARTIVFSEPPVDFCYEENFPVAEDEVYFSVEYLPGQFDQRADSAMQCVKLLAETEEPLIQSATTYVLKGSLSEADVEAVKNYVINPVDSRAASESKPETLVQTFPDPADVLIFDGFCGMEEGKLKELYDSLNLAMTFKDFQFIQDHFRDTEKRDPSMTEIRVLDTYWSDHCRHTTFLTELTDVEFGEGKYRAPIVASFEKYKESFADLYQDRPDKYVSLMDIALMGMKKLKAEGKLTDMEESDEINACSIVVPVDIHHEDGTTETEEWLIFFKNETHNHPTEIEPFGGAATCLGGAIRDPLSGRGYVYQAMRVTGAADPTVSLDKTLKGKLPQRKIVTGAAKGYSSYGNQIGLATGLVDEIYHPDYVAKRLEIGAVMGAAPRKNVIRENSDPGDQIILLGGRTDRDGIGGATGSSKAHSTSSIDTCGAEVQKGNAPTERKIQRLFRRAEVTKLIKKCNDFGAGGVSVAIGELAPGLHIYLDRVPKKYAGLDGTELAISESQERMAIVVDPKDVDQMMAYAAEENLEAVVAAEVTEDPRLVMEWRGKEIVNISRAFLDTNGAHQEATAFVEVPDTDYTAQYAEAAKKSGEELRADYMKMLADLNVCGKKGLVEMFDSSIGAATVTMPYGGKYQMTPIQTMTAKLPMDEGDSDTVTMMSYGFDPYLSSWSPYHGAVYAVITSVAKIVAAGGDATKIHFTFQEFFKRLGTDPKRWGQPLAALLVAYEAQMSLGLASIGGKDSMSGSFNEIDVPPTLVSFAVDVAKQEEVLSPELKKAGDGLLRLTIPKDAYGLPVYDAMMALYKKVTELIHAGKIVSAYALGGYGVLEAVTKMGFGNHLGTLVAESFPQAELMQAEYGGLLLEVPAADCAAVMACLGEEAVTVVGTVTEEPAVAFAGACVSLAEAEKVWRGTLEGVFPTDSSVKQVEVPEPLFTAPKIYHAKEKIARPQVFIPVFPGTNCEYDSTRAFRAAGADVKTVVFRNRNEEDIRESVGAFVNAIKASQMIMFPGGFSAGDEPDGSAKFIASIFRNPLIQDAVGDLLNNRDGLILGICNGFQALIKLGLVPYGAITEITEDSPTLTTNSIGRHISKSVYTKVVSQKSPWLMKAELGKVYSIPASHGEGRFVASEAWIEKLRANGQIATLYCDADGHATMNEEFNPNGSYQAIEGILSPDGRILGKMAHSERIGDHVAINITGDQNQHIFESGVAYFL